MPPFLPDRTTRYRKLQINLRSRGDDRFESLARLEKPPSVLHNQHKLYVRPQDLRTALSATGSESLPQRGLAMTMPVREIGSRLFASLFESALGSVLERERALARSDGAGVQLRLGFSLSDSESALAALPWEWMVDTLRDEFVALMGLDTITRTTDGAENSQLAASPEPPRVLIIANDHRMPGVPREVAAITEELARREITHAHVENPTRQQFVSVLRGFRPTVLHYCGPDYQGSDGAYIVFAGENSGSFDRVSPGELLDMLGQTHVPDIVTLNACTTSSFALALAPHVRAAVALSSIVTDDAAVELGTRLYGSLARGTAIDAAVAITKQELASRPERDLGVPSWAALVLYYSGPSAPSLFPDDARRGTEVTTLSAPPEQSENRERRKLELRRQTLERNKQDLDEQIAAFGAGRAPEELVRQRDDVAAALTKVLGELTP